ncbi:MAG: hypothetical protein V1912_04905 [bacterium]
MERIARVLAIVFVVVGLVAMGGVLAAGCGGSDQKRAKADLNTALTGLETAFIGLKEQGATLTVGDLKKTQPLLEAFDKVIEAAGKVSGVDVTQFETGFKALRAAVFALPDDLTIGAAVMQLMPMALAVLQSGEALKQFAAP